MMLSRYADLTVAVYLCDFLWVLGGLPTGELRLYDTLKRKTAPLSLGKIYGKLRKQLWAFGNGGLHFKNFLFQIIFDIREILLSK